MVFPTTVFGFKLRIETVKGNRKEFFVRALIHLSFGLEQLLRSRRGVARTTKWKIKKTNVEEINDKKETNARGIEDEPLEAPTLFSY